MREEVGSQVSIIDMKTNNIKDYHTEQKQMDHCLIFIYLFAESYVINVCSLFLEQIKEIEIFSKYCFNDY